MIDITKIIEEDSERKRQKHSQKQQALTVRDYLDLVEKDPLITQNAYGRGVEIICGLHNELVATIPESERWLGIDKRYEFFEKELFGVRRSIARSVEHLQAGKNRASTGKQVQLLVGPPASGKSTYARLLKQGFEKYNNRPVFHIGGCPKFEEPLHVIPRYLRKEFEEKLHVRIEGDLCPVCREKLDSMKKEDGVVAWWDVPVEQMSFSIQGVRGITSFEPSDEKTSDVTALTGRENISVTAKHGYDHPRAYELSGKIPKAERGLCEGRELTSSDPQVLQVFFSVAEERELEIQGSTFPHLSVDTIVLAHTNLTPFKKFAGNKEYEGLHNRFYVIPFPYPLRIKDELAVYRKLIEQESDFVRLKQCHIAPGSLELAALFAVLTRYLPSQKKVGLLTKAKLYNGDKALTELEESDTRPKDVYELLEEGQLSPDLAKREGMFGVSSRDVLAALNTEIVRQMERTKCLTPLSTIRALRDVFKEGHRMGYTPEEIARFTALLTAGETDSVVTEYDMYAVKKVSTAFLQAHGDLAEKLFDQYVDEDRYYRDTKRKFFRVGTPLIRKDPVTGKPREPNIKFMKSIEKHLGLSSDEEAEVFRGELLEFPNLSYSTYPPLAGAVECKLLEDSKDMLITVLAENKPLNTEEQRRKNDLLGTMQSSGYGFCPICAAETIDHARAILNK